jgi:integrase
MPRNRPLTPMLLRHIKPPDRGQTEISDGACPGLRLRISQGGTKTWVLGCRDSAGRARRFTLGQYPAVGLSDARELARTRRQEVKAGADPVAEAKAKRRQASDAKDGIGTLSAVLNAYARLEGHRRRSWTEMRRRIESVFSALLDQPAAELSGPMIQTIADAHPSRSSASAAVRYIRPILTWAEKRGFVARGIARELDSGASSGKRTRVLDDGELSRVVCELDAWPDDPHSRCLRFILWTAARLTEAADATWGEVDLAAGTWTIPAERDKSARGHRVLLPSQARKALAEWASDPLPEANAPLFAGRSGKPVGNWDRATKRLHEASGTSGWHRHDLRRTVATVAGRLGYLPHAIESLLGHLIGSSTGELNATLASTYNRSRYEREAGEALQGVADELDRIATGGGANVVRMRA